MHRSVKMEYAKVFSQMGWLDPFVGATTVRPSFSGTGVPPPLASTIGIARKEPGYDAQEPWIICGHSGIPGTPGRSATSGTPPAPGDYGWPPGGWGSPAAGFFVIGRKMFTLSAPSLGEFFQRMGGTAWRATNNNYQQQQPTYNKQQRLSKPTFWIYPFLCIWAGRVVNPFVYGCGGGEHIVASFVYGGLVESSYVISFCVWGGRRAYAYGFIPHRGINMFELSNHLSIY